MTEPRSQHAIEQHLRSAFDASEADRMWRSFECRLGEHEVRRRRAKRVRWTAGAGAIALAAAAAVLALWTDAPAPGSEAGALRLAAGHDMPTEFGTAANAEVVHLEDGSRIEVAQAARAALLSNDGQELVTEVQRGGVTFDVRPGGSRRWVVQAGRMRVEVLGTRFRVTSGEVEAVRVERGVVLVSHPTLDTPVHLTAGQSLRFQAVDTASSDTSDDGDHVLGERAAPPMQGGPASGTVTVDLSRAAEPPRVHPRPPTTTRPALDADDWRARARAGDWEAAWALLGPARMSSRIALADADELLALSDVARRAGHPRLAAAALQRLLQRAPGGPRAGVAAFTLGRLQLDRLGQPRAAARSFALVRRHATAGALLEDAMGLEARAAMRGGNVAEARAAAQRYLARFPNGRRAEAMREWAGAE